MVGGCSNLGGGIQAPIPAYLLGRGGGACLVSPTQPSYSWNFREVEPLESCALGSWEVLGRWEDVTYWGFRPWVDLLGSSTMLSLWLSMFTGVAPSENPGPHPGAAVHALGCGWHLRRHSCPSPHRATSGQMVGEEGQLEDPYFRKQPTKSA